MVACREMVVNRNMLAWIYEKYDGFQQQKMMFLMVLNADGGIDMAPLNS